jgi:type IV secretion system protein VirB8
MINAVFKKFQALINPAGKTRTPPSPHDKTVANNNRAMKNKTGQYSFDQYYKDGETWDQEICANIDISRRRAWLISFFCMGTTVLALLSLALLLPLKSFAPYVITVDKSTGYVEVTKGLYEGNMTVDQAVTESNLVRYVNTRESYNPSVLRENYNFVTLMSAGTALSEFQRLWDGKNPDNPSVQMGTKAAITIKVKSVSFLNDRTAAVRFLREYHAEGQIKTSDWNAVMDFQYVRAPMRMEDRFQNPLGFQITSYRVNPETPEVEKTTAQSPSDPESPQAPEQKSQPPQQ